MRNRRIAVSPSGSGPTIAQRARAVVVAAERFGRAAVRRRTRGCPVRGARERAGDRRRRIPPRRRRAHRRRAARRTRRRRRLRSFRGARWRFRAPAARERSPRPRAAARWLRRRPGQRRRRRCRRRSRQQVARALPASSRSRSAPSVLNTVVRRVEVALGRRSGSGRGREAAERQVAERRLIALAEQLEDVRALREVVVRG